MIARRAAHASMTIVGDLGQATHPLAAGSWPELRLGKHQVRTLDLPAGYRVPQVIAADHLADSLNALPVSQVKCLEYDRVVLVEPADIVAAEPRGMNRLYIALTRAVAELVILHTKPLPENLTRPR